MRSFPYKHFHLVEISMHIKKGPGDQPFTIELLCFRSYFIIDKDEESYSL